MLSCIEFILWNKKVWHFWWVIWDHLNKFHKKLNPLKIKFYNFWKEWLIYNVILIAFQSWNTKVWPFWYVIWGYLNKFHKIRFHNWHLYLSSKVFGWQCLNTYHNFGTRMSGSYGEWFGGTWISSIKNKFC